MRRILRIVPGADNFFATDKKQLLFQREESSRHKERPGRFRWIRRIRVQTLNLDASLRVSIE